MYLMYLRKSRSDDANKTVEEVLAKHEAILQEFCTKQYGEPLDEKYIYREVVSGETIQDRPQIKNILQIITKENIDGVIVIEPQRLSRGDLSDCGQIIRCFKYTNTKIITPRITYDLNNDYDLFFFEKELRQGNEYLEYLKRRMSEGKNRSVKDGQYIASIPPYGYDKIVIDNKKTLIPNDKSEIVKLIYDLFINGTSYYAIVNQLNDMGVKSANGKLWHERTVKKILSNIHYIGKVKFFERQVINKVNADGEIVKGRAKNEPLIVDGLHQAIIDETTFNKAQSLIGRQSTLPSNKKFASPFATLVKCGCCGRSVTLQSYGYTKPARMTCRCQRFCGNHSISYIDFVNLVISELKRLLSDIQVSITNDTTNNENSLYTALQGELTQLERKELKLFDLIENELITNNEFKQRKEIINADRAKLEKSLEKLKEKQSSTKNIQEYSITLYEAIEQLQDDSIKPEIKNRFLKGFIERIEYTRIDEPKLNIVFL